MLYNFYLQNPPKNLDGHIPSSIKKQMRYYLNSVCCVCDNTSNLVVNGDFAAGATDTDYVIPPGWELIDDDGNNQITENPIPPPPSPATRAFRAGNVYRKSFLSQAIPTIPGISYTLSYSLFDAGNLSGAPWDDITNLIYFSASVSDDNTPIGNVISYTYPDVDNGFGWRLITSTFIAASQSTRLTFTSSHPPQFFYLTGISVIPVQIIAGIHNCQHN